MDEKLIYLKYVGAGSIPDIPARDLTKEEAGLHGIQRLLSSGLYELADSATDEYLVTLVDIEETQPAKKRGKKEVNNG